MPRYRVDWTEYRHAYVEANNEDEAMEEANNLEIADTNYDGSDYYTVEEIEEPKEESDATLHS